MTRGNRVAAFLGVFFTLLLWPASGPAQTASTVPPVIPANQQATKEQLYSLFKLIRVPEQVASIRKTMPALIQQQMTAQFRQMQQNQPELASKAEAQQFFTDIMTKYMERAMALNSTDEMMEDMAGLYQKYMTGPDIDRIIDFYSSPAGQHLLDVQPTILQEYLPVVLQRIQNRVKALNEEMTKELKSLLNSKSAPSNKQAL